MFERDLLGFQFRYDLNGKQRTSKYWSKKFSQKYISHSKLEEAKFAKYLNGVMLKKAKFEDLKKLIWQAILSYFIWSSPIFSLISEQHSENILAQYHKVNSNKDTISYYVFGKAVHILTLHFLK